MKELTFVSPQLEMTSVKPKRAPFTTPFLRVGCHVAADLRHFDGGGKKSPDRELRSKVFIFGRKVRASGVGYSEKRKKQAVKKCG